MAVDYCHPHLIFVFENGSRIELKNNIDVNPIADLSPNDLSQFTSFSKIENVISSGLEYFTLMNGTSHVRYLTVTNGSVTESKYLDLSGEAVSHLQLTQEKLYLSTNSSYSVVLRKNRIF